MVLGAIGAVLGTVKLLISCVLATRCLGQLVNVIFWGLHYGLE